MKKNASKLTLSRETLRTLADSSLNVRGGFLPVRGMTRNGCQGAESQEVSICVGCTGPLDTCPPQSNTCA